MGAQDTIDKGNCPIPNLRAHYVDTRSIKESGLGELTEVLAYFKFYPDSSLEERKDMIAPFLVNKGQKKLKGKFTAIDNEIDPEVVADIMKDYISRDKFMRHLLLSPGQNPKSKDGRSVSVWEKQLLSLDTEDRKILRAFVKDWIIETDLNLRYRTLMNWTSILDLLERLSITNNVEGELLSKLDFTYFAYSTWMATMMDAYAMARILRNFGNGEPRNIIVLAGSFHTRRYEEVLMKVGCKLVNSVTQEGMGLPSGSKNCVYTRGFTSPWFPV